MLAQLLPQPAANAYAGKRLAPWLLGAVLLTRAGMGVNSIINGRYVVTRADAIPLDTFSPESAQAVLALFGIWGVAQLMLVLLGVVVLVRYRSLVPFMFALLVLEFLARKLVLVFVPLPRSGPAPGATVNTVMLGVMLVGLALSLWPRAKSGILRQAG